MSNTVPVDTLQEWGLNEESLYYLPPKKEDMRASLLQDPKKFLHSPIFFQMVSTFRDAFGNGPVTVPNKPDSAWEDEKSWGEYLRCTNGECGKIYSVSDVFAPQDYTPLESLDEKSAEDFCCPDCGSETEFFWPVDDVVFATRKRLSDNTSTLSLLHDSELESVQGFQYGVEENINDVWERLLKKMYEQVESNMTKEEFLQQVSTNGGLTDKDNILHIVETAQRFSERSPEALLALTRTFLTSIPEEKRIHTPGLVITKRGIRVHQFLKMFGWKEIVIPEDSDIVVLTGSLQGLLDYFPDNLKQFRRNLLCQFRNLNV